MQMHTHPITWRQGKLDTSAGAEVMLAPVLAAGQLWISCAKGTPPPLPKKAEGCVFREPSSSAG